MGALRANVWAQSSSARSPALGGLRQRHLNAEFENLPPNVRLGAVLRNFADAVAFFRSPNARLILVAIVALSVGYGLKSSHAAYALASSPSGTFRLDTISGKAWVMETQNGRMLWVPIAER